MAFTGLHVVDAELRSMNIFESLGVQDYYYSFRQLLVKNAPYGCTMMMNRRLWENIGDYSEEIDLHDTWIALYASAVGKVCYVPMALSLYRQHGGNAIGFGDKRGDLRGGAGRFFGWLFRKSKASPPKYRRRLEFFRARYRDVLPPENRETLDKFMRLLEHGKLVRAVKLMFGAWPLKGSLGYKCLAYGKIILC